MSCRNVCLSKVKRGFEETFLKWTHDVLTNEDVLKSLAKTGVIKLVLVFVGWLVYGLTSD